MPEEMTKLRNALDARKIYWIDKSDTYEREFPFLDMCIYRTWFLYNGNHYSVISGLGTYGGQWGLLELMINDNEPKGSLTAEGVLTIMDGGELCLT